MTLIIPKSTSGFRKLMGFIDGENLVFQYKKFLENGKKPKEENEYREDVYVWNPNTINPIQLEALRISYYTYATGSDELVNNVKDEIKKLNFRKDINSSLPNNLTPIVFKKYKKSSKTKGVDIKMTVDILMNSYNDNLDTVLLVAGDGDYLPVIKEVLRSGKQIYLAFFSLGLNKELLNYVDKFICLDDIYFNE